jgi:phage/plasmid-like protein (TIGR03299 family)
MADAVETMFYVREIPWHGLGVRVEEAPTSKQALITAGLDWKVESKSIFVDNRKVKDFYANVRDNDNSILGIVSNTYKIVQNEEAFAFTDQLLENDKDVRYETAGSLHSGRKTWLLAKMPDIHLVDDPTNCFVTFMNSFDGKSGLRVFVTPVRVVCNNTLNMALSTTPRSWSANHSGNIKEKLEEAKRTLIMAKDYFKNLETTSNILVKKEISDKAILEFIDELLPIEKDASDRKESNVIELRKELYARYKNAPDLKKYAQTQWALINSVSDFASHTIPLRRTEKYKENNMVRVLEGHPILDRATKLLKIA